MLTVPPARPCVDLGRGILERQPDALGDGETFVAAGVVEHDGELLAAEPADQVERPELGASGRRENLQHAIANGVAEAVVDRLEVIEVGEQHRRRPRLGVAPLAERHHRLDKGAAVGDAGERIDQRRGLVAQLGALLRHRQQDEGDRDGEQQRLEAQHGEPHAVEHLVRRCPRQHLRQRECAAGTARRGRTEGRSRASARPAARCGRARTRRPSPRCRR